MSFGTDLEQWTHNGKQFKVGDYVYGRDYPDTQVKIIKIIKLNCGRVHLITDRFYDKIVGKNVSHFNI